MPQENALVALCNAGVRCDARRKPARAKTGGETYAVFEVDGRYYVTDDACNARARRQLSEGYLDGARSSNVRFTRAVSDVRNGTPDVAALAPEPVRSWTAHLRDGKIRIDPMESRHARMKRSLSHKPKLAIAMGDPAGIGPEIRAEGSALDTARVLALCTPVLFVATEAPWKSMRAPAGGIAPYPFNAACPMSKPSAPRARSPA